MTVKKMVSKGFFPEELPPPFTTKDLGDCIDDIVDDLLIGEFTSKPATSKATAFSVPKIKAYRRALGVPNPLHFCRLATTITDEWDTIVDHCEKSHISLSRIKQGLLSKRAILGPDFNQTANQRIIRATGYRYLLRIDVARFYNSIYTHSIPWALHSKELAKVKRKRTELFGNAIDADSRNLQDGQTIGLPIGPDTSRIISEIILASIDQALQEELNYVAGLRIVDDYYLYFKTLGDLEIGRAVMQKQLKEYELELNQTKEEIIELPDVIESPWFNDLREFSFRNNLNSQRKDIIAYFDKAIAFAKQFPEDFVLAYAVSKLQATVFQKKNWAILQSLLLNTLYIEPKVLPSVTGILIKYKKTGYPIDTDLVTQMLEDFILFHAQLNNDFEICWSLWITKALKLKLSEKVGTVLSNLSNPFVVLTALDLNKAGSFTPKLDTTNWRKLAKRENLYTEYWLIAYEAVIKGWITPTRDYIADDPFFAFLREKKVSFYHGNKTLDTKRVKMLVRSASLEMEMPFTVLEDVPGETVEKETVPSEPLEDLPF